MRNEKRVMTWLVTEECRVFIGSFPIVPEVHKLFNLRKFYWMARDLDSQSENIVL